MPCALRTSSRRKAGQARLPAPAAHQSVSRGPPPCVSLRPAAGLTSRVRARYAGKVGADEHGTHEGTRRLVAEPWRRIYGTEKWKRVRANARRRAGGCCEQCGREAKTLDVHHRTPLKDGGLPYDPDNLVVLCRPCHRELENPGRPFFRSRPPTSPPVGISPPVHEKAGDRVQRPGIRARTCRAG
jgi:hypothetical protein